LILLLLLLPDTWAINKRFIMLAVNRWNETYERVLLGGLTCDSDDYYNSEQNMNAIYRNTIKKNHCTSGFLIQVLIRKQLADMEVTPLLNSTTQTHLN
jgi:arginine decarboxylase-like protein